MKINSHEIIIEIKNNIFINASMENGEHPTYVVSLSQDLIDDPTDPLIEIIKKAGEVDPEDMFTDGYPGEPSDDHFLVLSLDNKISLLPQEKEALLAAFKQLENGQIFDIGRVRIEDCLA